MLIGFPPVIGLPDDRVCQFVQPLDVIVRQLAVRFLHRSQVAVQCRPGIILCRSLCDQRVLRFVPDEVSHIKRALLHQAGLQCRPVQCLFLFLRGVVENPQDCALCLEWHSVQRPGLDESRQLFVCQLQRQVSALRRVNEAALDDLVPLDFVNVEAVFHALIIERQLVRAAAVIGRRVASEPLGFVDVSEAPQRHPCAVDGLRQDHHVLPREEGLTAL